MAVAKKQYEAMFLFGPSALADLDAAIATAKTMVERHGGEIILIKKWDERKLAYEIKKQKRGTFIICYFKGPGAAIASIERDVNLSDDALRVLITDADHLTTDEMAAVEPQPIQPREERPSWDRPQFDGDRPRRDDRGPRDDRPRDDRPREDRPRDDRTPRPPKREEPAAAAE